MKMMVLLTHEKVERYGRRRRVGLKNIAELRRTRRLEASQGSSIGAQVPHQVPSNKSPPIWREGAPQSCCLRTITHATLHKADSRVEREGRV